MTNREERYHAAVHLAELILANPAPLDELFLEQARDDVTDRLVAGRRDQSEIYAASERARTMIEHAFGDNQTHSIGVRHLHAVTEREFRGMAYGRDKDE